MLGKILLINGTSSAGKSSVAKKLHALLSSSSIIMSIDDFMRAETTQKARELGCHIGIGSFKSWWLDLQVIIEHLPIHVRDTYFRSCLLKFYHEIKQHVLSGKLVIIDMVLEFTHDFYDVLENLSITMVLIYTPITKLFKNFELRNQSEDAYHRRFFASTMRQFRSLYRPLYEGLETADQVIDTIDSMQLSTVCDYLKKEAYWDQDKVERFCHMLMYIFTRNTPDKIAITPTLDYDCIVNTEKLSLDECIKQVLASIQTPFVSSKK